MSDRLQDKIDPEALERLTAELAAVRRSLMRIECRLAGRSIPACLMSIDDLDEAIRCEAEKE